MTTNSELIDRLVVVYNAHDARAFADTFTEDAFHGRLHAADPQRGREEIFHRYVDVFNEFPENTTRVEHRIEFGPYVIDHEILQRTPTSDPINVVAVYTIENGQIARLEFIRE